MAEFNLKIRTRIALFRGLFRVVAAQSMAAVCANSLRVETKTCPQFSFQGGKRNHMIHKADLTSWIQVTLKQAEYRG